jgi:hydroxymethylbilane synthase
MILAQNHDSTPAPRLRIGTRGSDLALWQAHTIQGMLEELGYETAIEIIKTQGDRIDNIPFSEMEGKNFFTKELEDAQLEGRVDLAVHSLKDLATEMPAGLMLTALVGREDPRDTLLVHKEAVDQARLEAGETLPLKDGAKVGTGAARREAMLRYLRPDLEIAGLRGNVPTRVSRLREGRYDAILLAQAGIKRLELDLSDLFVKPLPVDEFVPAPAQGMLGIQCRAEGDWSRHLAKLDCPAEGRAVAAEREILEKLEGGCQLPFGINIRPDGDAWKLECFLATLDGDREPLRLSREGTDLDALKAEVWNEIRAYRNA